MHAQDPIRHLRILLLCLAGPVCSTAETVPPPAPVISRIDAKSEAGGDLLRIRAVDHATGQAIDGFRIISGTEVGRSVQSPEFAARHPGQEAVNWQPHTLRSGKEGRWDQPMDSVYDPLALRVEADGFMPQRALWIRKDHGSQEVVFRLARDPGRAGRVRLPDGSPAAGAHIGIALPQRALDIDGTGFSRPALPDAANAAYRWRVATRVIADADGRFVLPSETDPACAVVAVHEKGMVEMFHDDFVADPTITLRPWGGIRGTVKIGEGPGKHVEVTCIADRGQYGYPFMVTQHVTVRTGEDGHFEFQGIAPGLCQVSLFGYFPDVGNEGGIGGLYSIAPPEGAWLHVVVEPGKTAMIELGGAALQPLPEE